MVMDGVIGAIVSELMVGLKGTEEPLALKGITLPRHPQLLPPASRLFTWAAPGGQSKESTLATVTRHPCPQDSKGLHHPAIR